MNNDRNTYNNEDFVYMGKLLQKHEIVLERSGSHSIILVKAKNSFQSIETISEILNLYLEITEETKNHRWVCYNGMVVLLSTWENFFNVFGNPVKAIIHYCENIGKEVEKKPFHHSDLHPESETLKQLLGEYYQFKDNNWARE